MLGVGSGLQPGAALSPGKLLEAKVQSLRTQTAYAAQCPGETGQKCCLHLTSTLEDSYQHVQNTIVISDGHTADSTDWAHRHGGHLLAKVRAGPSQAEQLQTTVIKSPFQKHSIKHCTKAAKNQERGQDPPSPCSSSPNPKSTTCSRKKGSNYLFWFPLKIPSHISFCSWLRVVPQPVTAQCPSQLGGTLVPPASR